MLIFPRICPSQFVVDSLLLPSAQRILLAMGRPPFTKWSDTDHSGPIIITTVLGLVYWLVPAIGQQWISFGRKSMLSWADYLYVASMVRLGAFALPKYRLTLPQILGLAQSVVILVASSRGLGRSTKALRTADAVDSLRVRSPSRQSTTQHVPLTHKF